MNHGSITLLNPPVEMGIGTGLSLRHGDTMSENNSETAELWSADDTLAAGDECPEGNCGIEMHELDHERTPQLGTERHPDAPETEIVCRHHGVQEAY